MKNSLPIMLAAGLLAGALTGIAQTPFKQRAKQPSGTGTPGFPVEYRDASLLGAAPLATLYQPVPFQMPVAAQSGLIITDIRYQEEGLPIMIKTSSPNTRNQILRDETEATVAALAWLGDMSPALRLPDAAQAFEAHRIEMDADQRTHVHLNQVWNGIPVYGGEIVLHFAPSGEVIMTGRYRPEPGLPTATPAVDAATASATAEAQAGTHHPVVPLSTSWQQVLGYTAPVAELVVYTPATYQALPRLTWHVTVRPNQVHRMEYFVDAQSGAVLHAYDHTCSVGPVQGSGTDLNGVLQTLQLFQNTNGQYYMVDASRPMYTGPTNSLPAEGTGYILTGDANNANVQANNFTYVTSTSANTWSNKAVSAHVNGGKAYTYFLNTHQRNSINGTGGDIYSFINVADDDNGGLDNAFWNGAAMFYGNGRTAFKPLSGSLDVAGHEMSHGVVQGTANLEYQGQSGALNESFADIFGVMIDRDDWLLGEEVVKLSAFPSGALRSMSDPHNGGSSLNDNGWQPRTMSEIYTGPEDNGGVHINSGIVNWAFYKFATAVGKDKAEKVYYKALKDYLTRSSQFIDCRLAVVQAATDLHGANSAEVSAAKTAFDQVGILDNTGGGGGGGTGGQNYQYQLPVNPGPDFIVSTDTNPADPTELYISSTVGSNFQALSQVTPLNRISVSDNGSVGYFVGEDHHIYGLFMNAANPQQVQVSSAPFWDNVAISRDGNRLAAISTEVDTSIYVFNLAANPITGVKYRIYNPTTASGGVNAGGVLYADAIEWDHTGEYIMYDAYNEYTNSLGTDLSYWDVNFIRTWNRATNDYGDGTVVKLYTNLPAGISIGNAVFSKNSVSVVAFDYIDNNTAEYSVVAANIESGDLGTIFTQQNILGYPDFSKLDDKMIFNALSTNNDSLIAVISLGSNKITPVGNATGLIGDAKWGVWYATGNRVLNVGIEDLPVTSAGVQVYPNPFVDRISITCDLVRPAAVEVTLLDMMGRELRHAGSAALRPAGPQALELEAGDLPAGHYVLRIVSGGQAALVKIVKD
ncbi:MAG: M4 family metallopeptidase [Bacteroidia bacterium]|nr:M4 family metallopeptidase [Bacteroidia bacterium]